MNASCFSLDSYIPFVFIISVSFSFFLFLCVRDVAGLCGLRFGEVFHNFRNPITQRYGSFPFFFLHGLFRNLGLCDLLCLSVTSPVVAGCCDLKLLLLLVVVEKV